MYLVSTVLSVTTGLFIVNTLQPGNYFSEEKIEFKEKYASKTEAKMKAASGLRIRTSQFLVDIVPQNFVQATSNNKNMLQVIFFAILFGISMIMLPDDKTIYVKGFLMELMM